jgi:hypothetical protein
MVLLNYLEIYWTFLVMDSTENTVDQSEATACYTEQRKQEEELLASMPGEEDAGQPGAEVNPNLLDVSMEDTGASGSSGSAGDGSAGDGNGVAGGLGGEGGLEPQHGGNTNPSVGATAGNSPNVRDVVVLQSNKKNDIPNPIMGGVRGGGDGVGPLPPVEYLSKNKLNVYLAARNVSMQTQTIPDLNGGQGSTLPVPVVGSYY